jgi:hypothetical protein
MSTTTSRRSRNGQTKNVPGAAGQSSRWQTDVVRQACRNQARCIAIFVSRCAALPGSRAGFFLINLLIQLPFASLARKIN